MIVILLMRPLTGAFSIQTAPPGAADGLVGTLIWLGQSPHAASSSRRSSIPTMASAKKSGEPGGPPLVLDRGE